MAGGIYGLSGSGMDIDELVKGMMKTQQARYDKLYKQKTAQTWKKEEYNVLYKSLYKFRYTTLTDFKTQSNLTGKKAISNDESVVTVTALGDAAQMSHDISVKQLASNAFLQSKSAVTRNNTSSPKSIKLSDIMGISAEEIANGGDKVALSFSLNDGQNETKRIQYTYDDLAKGTTLNDLVYDIDKLGINIQAGYDNNNDSFSLYSKVGGDTNGVTLSLDSHYTYKNPTNGTVTQVALDNKALKNTAQFINNLHLANYNSATQTMGNEMQISTNKVIGSGMESSVDITGKFFIGEMLGVDTAVPVKDETDNLWYVTNNSTGGRVQVPAPADENVCYVMNSDGTATQVSLTDEVFKVNLNGTDIAFTYGDLRKDLGSLNSKFNAAGIAATYSAEHDAATGKDIATLKLTEKNGQAISLNAGSGALSGAFVNLLNLSPSELSSTAQINAGDTMQSLAGNPSNPSGVPTDTAMTLTINSTEVSFTYAEMSGSMDDFVAKINNSGTGATASFANGKFSISNADGSEVKIAPYDAVSEKFLNNLKLSDGNGVQQVQVANSAYTVSKFTELGQSAKAVIDGKEYTSDSNIIKANSVIYTLNKVSDTTPTGGYETSKVTVNSDNEVAVDTVKKFVEEYNKMLDELNTKIYETYDKNYLPLTDEEKSGMSESQIKKWEEKAKTGLLAKDSILKDTVNQMRSALSTVFTNTGKDYTTLSSIGLKTLDYTEHGKIELDEDTLRKALEKDPDIVYKMFGTQSDVKSERGIAYKLTDAVQSSLDKLKTQAGITADTDDESYVGKKISTLSQQMKTLMERMERQEAMYYKKFNAMETAISQLNNQYNYITSAFGSSS